MALAGTLDRASLSPLLTCDICMSILAFPAAVGRSAVNESIVSSEPNPFTSENRRCISMKHRSLVFLDRGTDTSRRVREGEHSSPLNSTSAIVSAYIAANTNREPWTKSFRFELYELRHAKRRKAGRIVPFIHVLRNKHSICKSILHTQQLYVL
jgi:hypothetical protein